MTPADPATRDHHPRNEEAMTTQHRAEAERMLADARKWAAQAGELSPKASERACLAYAQVHALLAIHDEMTTADRYAANEAKQREAGADPLDEDDHRDRMDRHGDIWRRNPGGCWHTRVIRGCLGCKWTLAYLDERHGPLTFAPEAAQEATGGDLSASEGESEDMEGPATNNAQKAILCPECDHHIHTHDVDGCLLTRCDCPRTPEDVAQAMIERAVEFDAEFSRLLAVSTDPTAALRRAAMMEAVGVTDDQAKLFAQILAKGRLLPDDLQRLKAAVEQAGGGRG